MKRLPGPWIGTLVLLTVLPVLISCGGGSKPADTGSAGGAAAPSASASQVVPGRKPNIILILTDDEAASDFAYMRNTLSLIKDQGLFLPNYFVNVSSCCPSRTTTLRGQYAHSHGVLSNGAPNGGYPQAVRNRIEDSTIALWLQSAGYRTGLFGKYLNGWPNLSAPKKVPPGWDEWHSPTSRANSYNELDYGINDNGTLSSRGHAPSDFLVDVLATHATNFIRDSAKGQRPFFAYITPFPPHDPFVAAERHAGLFTDTPLPQGPAFNEADVSDKPQYVQNGKLRTDEDIASDQARFQQRLRSLQSVDEMVKSIVTTLDETNQLANTYIFVTSDNGWMYGDHRIPRSKFVPYETSIRVSMMVRGPGIPGGVVRGDLSGNTDLAPTFAAIANAPAPDFVEGRSLLGVLSGGQRAGTTWRNAFLIEFWTRPGFNDGGDESGIIPEFHGFRTLGGKYVEYVTGERELYDLSADPDELENLVSRTSPATLDALSAYLGRLKTCKGAQCRSIEDEPPPPIRP